MIAWATFLTDKLKSRDAIAQACVQHLRGFQQTPGKGRSDGVFNNCREPLKWERLGSIWSHHLRLFLSSSPPFSCRYDYVEVYNGGEEHAPMLGKFCGKIAPSPIISSGAQLLIKFVSDYETHGAGFSVRYEVFKTGGCLAEGRHGEVQVPPGRV